eukprot:5337-Heterococcus_DN1.PRE.1
MSTAAAASAIGRGVGRLARSHGRTLATASCCRAAPSSWQQKQLDSTSASARRSFHTTPAPRAVIQYITDHVPCEIGQPAPAFSAPAVIDGEIGHVNVSAAQQPADSST